MKYRIVCLLLLCSVCYSLLAQSPASEIGIRSDNDAYLARRSDKYYTDGLFLFYRHALPVGAASKLQNKVLGFELGQKIFNPHTGSVTNKDPQERIRTIDRPFAAYLYLEGALNLLYKNESNLKLIAQIGYVGPNAFGKQVQTFVHKGLGFYKPQGWEYQVDNDPELNLSAEYNTLLARASWIDLSFTSHINMGNGFSGAGVGSMVRVGHFNQLYNSISTQSSSIRQASSAAPARKELFFYYKPQIDEVAYDATVQGSLFRHKKDNDMAVTLHPNHIVLVSQLGAAYSGQHFAIDAACIFHTKDVKGMRHPHQWGSVSLLMHLGGS